MATAIEIKGLGKKFKDVLAVDGISLTVEEGTLLALLGENGAGKTTTIKMLCCLMKPSFGDALVFGHSILTEEGKIKEFTNISPQETAVAPNLTVKENLELIAEIYGFSKEKADKKVEEILSELKLTESAFRKAKKLSGGMQRRLSLGMALITEPKILFLDEPTLGLDVRVRRDLWSVIERVKKTTTVILTTHYLEEVEALADKVAIMVKGKIEAEGTVEELEAKTGKKSLEEVFLSVTDGENDYE